MSTLRFAMSDARRVAQHALDAPKQMDELYDIDCTGNQITGRYRPVTEPSVLLVHDRGVYLMSNGMPPDVIGGTAEFGTRVVAYAEGCHPDHDPDSYETASQLVGGDDFSDVLPWARTIVQFADRGATHLVIDFTQKRLALRAIFPSTRPRRTRASGRRR